MEPEGSSPHSQEPATCPYPEPDQSSPRLSILLLEDPFYLFIYLQRNAASLRLLDGPRRFETLKWWRTEIPACPFVSSKGIQREPRENYKIQ